MLSLRVERDIPEDTAQGYGLGKEGAGQRVDTSKRMAGAAVSHRHVFRGIKPCTKFCCSWGWSTAFWCTDTPTVWECVAPGCNPLGAEHRCSKHAPRPSQIKKVKS
jgi:hypothetical protein